MFNLNPLTCHFLDDPSTPGDPTLDGMEEFLAALALQGLLLLGEIIVRQIRAWLAANRPANAASLVPIGA